MSDKRDIWSGRVGFILATTGSAVGIGSIWKFPYEVGANGGSAFVLLYVTGLVFIVVPLMFAEFAIGRRGRGDPATSLAVVAAAHGASRRWALPGVLGFLAGIATVLSFNLWSDWHPLRDLDGFAQATIFDLLDYLTSNILLPIGGLAIAVFAGWAVPDRLLVEELRLTPRGAVALRVALRYVAPVGIAAATLAPVLV